MRKIILQVQDPHLPVQVYKTRVTEIETFHECSYKYKNQKMEPTEHLSDIFEQGDELHQVLQAYCVDPQRAQDMLAQIIKQKRHSVDIHWLMAAWNAAKPHIDKKRAECNVLYIEKKTNVMFVIGNKLVFVSGTMDVIREDGEIRDFKSSAQEWKPDVIGSKLQRRLYPLIYSIYRDQQTIDNKFVYFVVTKHKKGPRVQLLPAQTTYDTGLAFAENLLLNYTDATDQQNFPTTRGDHCFKCSLKRAGTCPLWSTDPKPSEEPLDEDRF